MSRRHTKGHAALAHACPTCKVEAGFMCLLKKKFIAKKRICTARLKEVKNETR